MCVERDVERLVFASSCSLYDGLPPGMHDETAADPAARRLRDLQALRRGGPARARRRGPVPGDHAQRHRLRLQPAHALRPRGQHVRQGRAAQAASSRCTAAAGCGARWSTSSDVSDAMIAGLEAPAEKVRGEIFNVLHSNYQIRELAMLVAGSVQLLGRSVTLEEQPAPQLTRDYECSNTQAREHARLPALALGRRGDRRHPAPRSTSRTARCSPTRATTTSAGSSC